MAGFVFFMTAPDDKLGPKALEESTLFPQAREKSGATPAELRPDEIAAVLALFELLGTWDEGKKDPHGNEN